MREPREEPGAGASPEPIPLDDPKLLKQYYAGQRLPSPVDGYLDLLGSRSLPDGSARLLFECNSSSLRFVLVVPKGTRRDREKVRDQIKEGTDPHCPRCGPARPLNRAGGDLQCPCGAVCGKAP